MAIAYEEPSRLASFKRELRAACSESERRAATRFAGFCLPLGAPLGYAREGDALVVTKLDRLARSVPHLCEIGNRLDAKGDTAFLKLAAFFDECP
jgi:hypothetical protein